MKRAVASAVAALLAFAAAQTAQAATWYWTGGGGDLNWFTAANWNSAADGNGDAAGTLASGDSFVFGSLVADDTSIVYNPSSSSFAIGSITFAAGCPRITVNGDKVNGDKIASVGSIANNSSYQAVFNNAVNFSGKLDITQSGATVKFAGGATGTQLARALDIHGKYTSTISSTAFTEYEGTKVCSDGKYYLPNATFHKHNADFHMQNGGYAEVKKALIKQHNYGKKLLGTFAEGAVFKITEDFEVNGNGKSSYITHYFCDSGNGTLVAERIRTIQGGCLVPARYNIIGSGGIIRGRYGYVRPFNKGTHEFGSYANWTMAYDSAGSNTGTEFFVIYKESSTTTTALIFNTTDYYDGVTRRTITSEAPIGAENASSAAAMSMTVKGAGRFVFANTAPMANIFSGGLTVQDSATVEVKKNSCPGKGKVSLNGTSTLELRSGASVVGALTLGGSRRVILPEAGTATISGKASFWNDAGICFHVGETGNAKLSFGTTPEFQKNITISFTEDSEPSFGCSYTLTQGAGLTALETDTTSFKLADGVRGKLSVENGELVYTVPRYFCITVR